MPDAGESSHRRTKSSALSLLRRKGNNDDDMSTHEDTAPSASGSGTGLGTTASAPTAPAHEPSIHPAQPPSVKGHSSKLSVSGSAIGRTISNSPSVAGGRSPYLSDKGTSLESSVRKFRIVDALRNGDTAFISKAIRESAENAPRMSTSSFTTFSGPLDDTTILHLAIQCAEQPVVEYVLSDGAGSLDINARDREGNTPLHVAAIQGRAQIVKLLLENKEINDAIANHHGRLPIDLARNPEIFQQLQLSRSLFAENKVRQVQDLILHGELKVLEQVLEESRFKTVLDINSPEFASEPTTVEAGGTLLHEAARRKNSRLIQVLLLHGADPFRRDRKGKLPQDVTKDEITRAMLKKSPAAVAAQRGIQEKAVLGSTTQGAATATPGDPLAGREAREMKGYLKKWTNYRKGYQLRWFVLEDGVLSYYKHQDDAGSACRGAINMRIAKLHMSADEKTKFEIHGKSSVKYTLKANHEVEAKRWFWALNNSIQWTKDQAKEEERQKARNAELLKQAKAEHTHLGDSPSENASVAEQSRSSIQLTRMHSSARASSKSGFPTIGSNEGDDFVDAATEADNKTDQNGGTVADEGDEDEDYDEHSSGQDAPPANKDAFNITAQSAKLQLESMAHVTAALLLESSKNPAATLTDPKTSQALSTYDAAIRSLTGLIGDLLRISKDRDAYWQYRLDRESEMRRMWEESMAQVAKEQEALEARVGEAESKRRITKRILKEVVEGGMLEGGQIPLSSSQAAEAAIQDEAQVQTPPEAVGAKSPTLNVSRRQTVMTQIADISDSESDGEEFFDAVDAGEVEVSQLPPSELTASQEEQQLVISDAYDISSSFKGYENGIRTRLKMDADDRPKISLWGILKSMVGKDMTKMTLPVSFNEPTSLLYRCGEDMEYADLLDLAADRTDSVERLLYVGAFAASEYASTIGRVAKPFNPLLGETFEYVRPDKNYRFFIEQVSHHPPIGAAWAESPKWTYYGESAVKSKFYGRSFDINPLGTWFLKLRPAHGGKEDFYTWKKVTSSVVGIITGNPVVDNYGPMEIKNWTTGEVCYIEFKPRGWTASSAYVITGKVVDANGRVRFSLGGRWNSKLYARYTPGFEATIDDAAAAKADTSGPPQADAITDPNKAFLIWQANPRPQGIPFNLTPFVLTFNHIDDQLRPWIAPTDSRLRPDQRAMEEGEYDFAATEKNRLEEGQRARRRVREAKGEEFIPAWFTKAKCEVTGESYWKFNGGYWEKREKAGPGAEGAKVWEGLEKIF